METTKTHITKPSAPQPTPAAARLRAVVAPSVQRATRVSQPEDPAEREAEATAAQVMRMAPPAPLSASPLRSGPSTLQREVLRSSPSLSGFSSARLMREARREADPEEPEVQRKADPEEPEVQRKAQQEAATPEAPAAPRAAVEAIHGAQGGGEPLSPGVRSFMEPRFGADFSQVRVHRDDRAARLNQQLSARAFTYGNHVFFGRSEYQPESEEGKQLIAHELTHTLQQTSGSGAVSRAPIGVQRLGLSDALDYFADKAYLIPGYRLFTLVIGVNPINMKRAPRTAANLLRALVELIPGGNLLVRALDSYGVFDKAGAWISKQLDTLGLSGPSIRAALMRFLKSLGWRDIFRLGSVWDRAKDLLLTPIRKLLTLARGLGGKLLSLVREAVLTPLAKLASKTAGYDLLKALLGRDPITGKAFPRTAASVIGGFMKLIGQEEIWKNLVKAKAVPRAWAWFQGAIKGLLSLVSQAPGLFLAALRSLTIGDLLLLPKAFIKLGKVFFGFIGKVLAWGGRQVISLLTILFDVVAPGLMPKLSKARGALKSILKDPIRFLRNLLRAGKLGFTRFVKGFVQHLKGALIGWLTGSLGGAGVHIPKALSFKEILPFVLDVLGLGWASLRQRLVKSVGETAVKAMEGGFALVKLLVTKGPAGVWKQLQQSLGDLRDTVLNGVIDFVRTNVIRKGVVKLLSMLSPAGAIIQAIIGLYDTVMFFVERFSQIGQLVSTVLSSLAAIAAGKVKPAAKRIEQSLTTALTLVISFLARFVGLGGIGTVLKELIEKVRKPVGKALDKVVKWIVKQARKLGKFVAKIGAPKDPMKRLKAAGKAAVKAAKVLKGKVSKVALKPVLAVIRARYGLKSLEPFQEGGKWKVKGVINPDHTTPLTADSWVIDNNVLSALLKNYAYQTWDRLDSSTKKQIESEILKFLQSKDPSSKISKKIGLLQGNPRQFLKPQRGMEEAAVQKARSMDGPTHIFLTDTVVGEIEGGAFKVLKTLNLEKIDWATLPAASQHKDYSKVIAALEAQKVGATKGAADRAIIADTLLAGAAEGITPVFTTGDKDVFKKMYSFHPKGPASMLGKEITDHEDTKDGFVVCVYDYPIKIIPVGG